MTYEVRAEVPDNREGITTLVNVRAMSYSDVWMEAERMKAMGWKVLSAPTKVEWPTFDLGNAA